MNLKILFAISSLFLISCGPGLRNFTQDMYDDYGWSQDELKKIQFYVSEDIVLWRKLSDEDTKIVKGKIRVQDESEIEEIIIKKGTPGLVVFVPKQNKFAISFDRDDSNYLMFGPNPKVKDRYVLLAKDWDRRKGTVTYGRTEYYTKSDSAFAGLLVDIKEARKLKYRSKKATGRKVRT